MKAFLTPLLLLGTLSIQAQLSGNIDYKHLGIRFTIPNGWVGQEMEAGVLLGHNSIPGFILIIPHQSQNMPQLEQEMAQGLQEEGGTALSPVGAAQKLSTSALGAEFGGLLEWQASKAYGIGSINPHGSGVYILALTSAQQYSEAYAGYAKAVWRSIEYYKPDNSGIINKWKQTLSQGRLTYMDSYYSPSYTDGGISGGYSQKRVIELCRQGHFFYSNQSDMSVSGANVSGYNQGSNQGHGSWEIAVNVAGSPILRLRFHDGDIAEYPLSYEGDALHLNGDRYYHTECEVCR